MNKWLKEAQDAQEDKLPKTLQDYNLMHPADAYKVPAVHVQRLRDKHLSEGQPKIETFNERKINWD